MTYEKALNQVVTIVRFRDGDTVEGFIRCGVCGCSRYEVIRLAKIESWEIKSPDRAKALSTARTLTDIYRGRSGPLQLRSHRRDRYGRLIGDIITEGSTLATELVSKGFAWYGVGEPEPATGELVPILHPE